MTDKIEYAGLDQAIAIASTAFVGIYDKGGVPYIMHCLHVMDKVKYLGTEAMIVAALHDLLEDTDWTPEALVQVGFNPHTVSLIELLTHKDGESYDDYIKRAALNNVTRAIKMEDIRHNSDPHRLKGLRDKDFKRLEKYTRAFAYLKEVKD